MGERKDSGKYENKKGVNTLERKGRYLTKNYGKCKDLEGNVVK